MSWRSLGTSMRLWLLSLPSYWRARDQARRMWFTFRLARYGLGRRSSAAMAEFGVGSRLTRQLLPTLILAAVAVVAVDWLAGLAGGTVPDIGLAATLSSRPDSATYTGFLIATAAFGATLLALFFTALSVVVSTGYSRAPVEVRSLLLNEQAGTAYTKAVGLLVAVSLLVLAADFLGYRPPVLTLVGIAVLGSVSVLALLGLGPRAFSFFDVAALGMPLRRQFREWSLRAARGSADSAFERHFQQQASDVLDIYPMLISSAVEAGEVAADQLERLGDELVRLWSGYTGTKTRISPNSLWFERQAAHRDWLMSNDIALQPALATGTGLPAEEMPDRLWVERRISRSLNTIFSVLLSTGRGQGAYRMALSLSQLSHGLASAFQIDAALICLEVLTRQRPMLVSSDSTQRPATLDRQLRYAVLDAQALAVVGLEHWPPGRKGVRT